MITIKRQIQFTRVAHGRRRVDPATTEAKPVEEGSLPRISRLMALAIRLDGLLRTGEVSDIYELARSGHVSQPRMSQILSLTLLAPDIQEELLFLPRVTTGKATIHEKLLRPISAEIDWARQREIWRSLRIGCRSE